MTFSEWQANNGRRWGETADSYAQRAFSAGCALEAELVKERDQMVRELGAARGLMASGGQNPKSQLVPLTDDELKALFKEHRIKLTETYERQFYEDSWQETRASEAGVLDLIRACLEAQAKKGARTLTVWYGKMPESNGKTNWTAILHSDDFTSGYCLEQSEYPDRVRYGADRVRWIIGELADKPDILAYDAWKVAK